MSVINGNNTFIACWDERNAQLNPNKGGFVERAMREVKNFVFYIPNCVIAACINPRHESHPLDSRMKIMTPDHVSLFVRVCVANGATPETPTVILFNPLGANDFIYHGLRAELTERKCNVVSFDYRGFGTTRRSEDLVIDGESVYQYVTKELGTSKNKVYFFGYSLGGAIAAQVKALHPESEGKYVGDRTFKSVFSLITENCCIERFGRLIKTMTSLFSSVFFAYPIYLLGWEWDGCKALAQLKGDKRVVYHPKDFLIPFKASLASQCAKEEVIAIDPKESGPSTHFSVLLEQTTVGGSSSAIKMIADFLSC